MGILKQIVACLATCGIKSKCNMRMCSCCISDCMVEEKPHYIESDESDESSKQLKKLKRANKQLVNRIRTTVV